MKKFSGYCDGEDSGIISEEWTDYCDNEDDFMSLHKGLMKEMRDDFINKVANKIIHCSPEEEIENDIKFFTDNLAEDMNERVKEIRNYLDKEDEDNWDDEYWDGTEEGYSAGIISNKSNYHKFDNE